MALIFAVDRPVTVGAERNQILFTVAAKVAPRLDVVDLQVSLPSTRLAAPSVALQDLLTQLLIRLGLQVFSPSLWKCPIHGFVPAP